MTKAFLAEVDTKNGTRYISKKGKLNKLPFFFAHASQLKNVLSVYVHGYSNRDDYYSPHRDREATRVCVVDNVEKGLRASTGANLAVIEFLVKEYSSNGQYAPKKPANAVFKIRFNPVHKQPNVKYSGCGKYSGGGKFGKTWDRQGDVRLHITNNLHRLPVERVDVHVRVYSGAEVLMIELDPKDGITPLKITATPIVEFYQQSPPCKKRWAELNRSSLVNAPDVASRSSFA